LDVRQPSQAGYLTSDSPALPTGCRAPSRTIHASLAGLAAITRPPSRYGQLFQGQSAQSTMSPAPANLAANLTAAEVGCVHVRIG
jgi:hypothetical protein